MLSLASLAASEECAAPSPVVVIPASDAANSTRYFAELLCEMELPTAIGIPSKFISTTGAPGMGEPLSYAPLWTTATRTDTCFRAVVDDLLSEEEAMALSQALEPALLAGLGADGTSVVPIPTAPAVGGVWAKAAAGDGERARLIALALQRSKEQLKAFGVAEDSLVPTPHVVARTDRPESVQGRETSDAAERARERRAALENGRWSIAQAIGEASHSVRPHIDALYMPNTRFTVLIYLTGQLVEGGETLIVDEVAGDVVTSGVLATPRAGRAFVYSSTAENVHTSLGALRGTRSMLQFWFFSTAHVDPRAEFLAFDARSAGSAGER